MDISKAGLDLIKRYEGLRLTAYKPVSTEKYWTIGYGHYGPDVTQGMTITQAQADAFLKQDCASAVRSVNALKLPLNQNQFDALVSFTYNCGAGNLKTLCKNRTVDEIGEKIVLYNKAGGKVLNGLVRRRTEEQALYKSGGVCVNPYTEPTRTIKRGCKGNGVKWVQWHLNRLGYDLGKSGIDGDCGPTTVASIKSFQEQVGITVDGLCGNNTRKYLKM